MLRHAALALLVLLLPVATSAQLATGQSLSNAPPSPVAPTGGAIIRGRVLSAESGLALRNSRVQITAPELSAPRVTSTDLEGRFEFQGLTIGRYTISAASPGFIGLSYGQTRPFEAGKPIALAEKQVLEDITLRLPTGGVIAGVVADEDGQPLVSANVAVLRQQFVRGRRQLTSAGTDRTNDLGEYRVYGLAPGSYVVAAGKRLLIGTSWALGESVSGYPQTYFPNATETSRAQPVAVKAGQTTEGINFSLTSAKAGSISGSVFDSMGNPALFPTGTVGMRRIGSEDVSVPLSLALSGDGVHSSYMVSSLAPGEYEVFASSNATGANPLVPQAVFTRVTLNGENLRGIDLFMRPLPESRGRVVVDPAASGSLNPSAVRLRAIRADPSEPQIGAAGLAPAAADWTFALRSAPGRAVIRPTLPAGWAIRAVRLRGVDVTDAGIEFRMGEDVQDIEVELTNRPIEVSGAVKGLKGEPIDDYTVLVFAREPRQRDGDSRHFAALRADQSGRFTFVGLAEGEYYAAALQYLDPGTAQDPALLERLERDAVLFAVREGESKSLDLKIIPQTP